MNPRRKPDPTSILNLPTEITIDILSQLPIQSITCCKCVCKKWLNLISSPQFAKYHLSISTPGLIVYQSKENKHIYSIFEVEDEIGLQHHDLHYKPMMKLDLNTLSGSLECSVNGLLCLCDWSNKVDEAIYICNPILREVFGLPLLPRPKNASHFPDIFRYGFGVSLLSSQYKVVRIFQDSYSETLGGVRNECMVYTLETHSWRRIGSNLVYEYDIRPSVGTFLNGNIHWLVGDAKGFQQISCFDLETELFKPFPPPFSVLFPLIASLTVIGSCLYFCNFILDEEIEIWIMKEYGVEESWTKEYVFDIYAGDMYGLNSDTFGVLKVFKDGDVLMLKEGSCLFYHCKKTETLLEIDLFKQDPYGWLEALLYIPSLVSLKSLGLENVISF